ncbi:MAG: 50S ribosomal protein L6 [Patescibacteria group bacterium]|jgi:large subunit ribosomal protein L6
MSKIGKKPVVIPAGVDFKISDRNEATAKGSKGELKQIFHPNVVITQTDGSLLVTIKDENDRFQRALWGLSRALLQNMIIGVSQGYERKLEINGVGYRAAVQGKSLNLNVGFSHPVDFKLPDGIEAKVEKNLVTLTGIDKQLLGETCAKIRRIRPPEPYKGKGIKYIEETIRRKAGKVVKSSEGK